MNQHDWHTVMCMYVWMYICMYVCVCVCGDVCVWATPEPVSKFTPRLVVCVFVCIFEYIHLTCCVGKRHLCFEMVQFIIT